MNAITDTLMKAMGLRRYEAEQNILAAAAAIIRDCGDPDLRAIIGSLSADGALWGARVMAEAEFRRRIVNLTERDLGRLAARHMPEGSDPNATLFRLVGDEATRRARIETDAARAYSTRLAARRAEA